MVVIWISLTTCLKEACWAIKIICKGFVSYFEKDLAVIKEHRNKYDNISSTPDGLHYLSESIGAVDISNPLEGQQQVMSRYCELVQACMQNGYQEYLKSALFQTPCFTVNLFLCELCCRSSCIQLVVSK